MRKFDYIHVRDLADLWAPQSATGSACTAVSVTFQSNFKAACPVAQVLPARLAPFVSPSLEHRLRKILMPSPHEAATSSDRIRLDQPEILESGSKSARDDDSTCPDMSTPRNKSENIVLRFISEIKKLISNLG